MALTLIVTDAGRAALVNAAKNGTAPTLISQVGLSGTAQQPGKTATALPGEFTRLATLSGDVIADDTIHLIVRDESAANYAVRSLGLYLSDGTLFAVYGQAGPIVDKSAQAIMLLAIDVQFADVSAAQLTFGDANFLNPPATTEQIGVVELATQAEANAGVDAVRVITPAAAKGAVTSWLYGQSVSLGSTAAVNFVLPGVHLAERHLEFQRNDQTAYFYGSSAGIGLFDTQHGHVWGWNYGGVFQIMGAKAWTAGNDGAGSGLDADLLDGQDSSFYANIPARLGYTPVRQGGGVGQNGNTVNIGWSGSRLKATVDATDQGNIVFDAHISDVWRSSNDGAGSGLDADLLDGWQRDDIRHWNNLLGVPFNWAGQGGQPQWVWGSNDGGQYYVWNPSNFSVNYANSAGNADLLDGQDSSFFTNIPARLGYTPVNKAGDTLTNIFSYHVAEDASMASRPNQETPLVVKGNGIGPAVMTFHRPGQFASFLGIDNDNQLKFGGWSAGPVASVIWHAANDGAGSGLDADLLDGQQGSFYTNIPARLGYQPVQQGTGVGQLSNVVKIGWGSNSRVRVTVDSTDQGNVVFDANLAGGGLGVNGAYVARNGNHLFGPDNDGAGSGLDADLLDGLQSTQFMRNFTNDWVCSEEGRERLFFAPNADTFARVTGAFRWQNASDANVGSIDEGGNLWLAGQVDALRVATRANGDGMAIKVGDDAWIGDVNWVNGIGIRGQQDSRAGFVTFGTSGFGLGCDAADATLRYAGNPVWHAGNDGAGSGLDADLLDGRHASDFALLSEFAASKAQNGYVRLPGGVIVQWGRFTANANGSTSCTFPISFPAACGAVTVSGVAGFSTDSKDNPPAVSSASTNGFNVFNADDQSTPTHFIAVGY